MTEKTKSPELVFDHVEKVKPECVSCDSQLDCVDNYLNYFLLKRLFDESFVNNDVWKNDLVSMLQDRFQVIEDHLKICIQDDKLFPTAKDSIKDIMKIMTRELNEDESMYRVDKVKF
jgi:hypothetical protein